MQNLNHPAIEPEAAHDDACCIAVDVSLIPDHVQSDLAAATFDFVNSILRQPGGREMLDRRTAERKARQTT